MSLEERFEIGTAINIGQIATAYEAVQRGLDRKVLLKVIHPQWKNDPELLERFDREGKAAAKVSHHNVVKIYDSGWEDGLPYIVLEWIDGGTLADRLQGGPLAQDEVKKIAVELLKGLAAVHQANLLHRDIKPDNIMLGTDGEARLTDFSLAGLGHVSTLTGHDGIVGSPAYMAPELLHGSPPDARSDLYAIGIVLLEAMTGSNPFQAASPMASLALVEKTTLPKLSGRPRLDPVLASLIDSLLEKRPELRPQSANEALRSLTGVTVDPPTPMAPKPPSQKPAFNRLALVGMAALVALTLLVIAGNYSKYTAPKAVTQKLKMSINQRLTETISSPLTDPKSLPSITDTRLTEKEEVVENNGTSGTIVLLVKPWGTVSIDGIPAGATPMEPLQLTTGKHTLRVTHPQFTTVQRDVHVTKDRQDTLSIDLKSESVALAISAIPWGYLWIDGDSLGLLPRRDPIWLSAGKHQLRIVHPDYQMWSEEVTLSKNESVNFKVNLADGTLIATPVSGGDQNHSE